MYQRIVVADSAELQQWFMATQSTMQIFRRSHICKCSNHCLVSYNFTFDSLRRDRGQPLYPGAWRAPAPFGKGRHVATLEPRLIILTMKRLHWVELLLYVPQLQNIHCTCNCESARTFIKSRFIKGAGAAPSGQSAILLQFAGGRRSLEWQGSASDPSRRYLIFVRSLIQGLALLYQRGGQRSCNVRVGHRH